MLSIFILFILIFFCWLVIFVFTYFCCCFLFIFIARDIKEYDIVWSCTSFYASPSANRRMMWDYLAHLRNSIVGPWLVFGDFNGIMFSHEVFGGQFDASRACLLVDMLANWNLLDLYVIGGLYTFRKNVQLAGHVRKKLDRVVVDADWQRAFPTANVEVLSQHGSDHNPLFISCSKFQIKRSKFF